MPDVFLGIWESEEQKIFIIYNNNRSCEMFRKIYKITQKFITNNNLQKKQNFYNKAANNYLFSTASHHPTIQKILDGEDVSNTDTILTEIGGLDDKNREIALKLVLKNIYSHKISTSTLSNPKFIKQATKSPLVYLDSLSFKLKELMRKLNDPSVKNDNNKQRETFDQINQTFVVCFQTLKKIPEDQKLKHQVLLYKRFADYNLLYLSGVVESGQKKGLLQKCCEFYRKTAELMDKLLKFQKEKINIQTQYSKSSKEKEEDKSLRLNAMNESMRMLIETNAQNTLHLFKALNELHDRQTNQKEFDNNVLQMLTSFQRAIAWYIILKGFSTHSIFYHRIKKIKADLNNYYRKSILPKRGGERIADSILQKEYSNDLEALYSQTKQDLQKLSNQQKYVSNAEELALLMLSIKVQAMKRLRLDESTFKEKLFSQIKAILDIVTHSGNRKAVSSRLGRTATQLLQNPEKKSSS